MSRRCKTVIVGGVIVVATVLVSFVHHCLLRAAVASYIVELKAKGEHMDLDEVIPRPALPEKNGVPLITNALNNVSHNYQSVPATNPPSAKRMVTPGKAMVGWQQPEIREISETTNSWEDLGIGLAMEKDALFQFQSLFDHPVLDFNLNYHQGFVIRDSHLSDLKWTSLWLSSAALYNLRQGESMEACVDVRTILAIVKGQTDERLEISQLVRMGITQIGMDTTWEILQCPRLSDDDLSQLQRDWQSLEFIGPLERALLVERLVALQRFEMMRQPSVLEKNISGGVPLWTEMQWRWFWSYKDIVRGLQIYQVLIDATRMAQTNNSFQSLMAFMHVNFERLGLKVPKSDGIRIDFDRSGLADIFSDSASDSFRAVSRAVNVEIARNLVITAIALKRFESRHHKLPASLDELKPDFISSFPSDPMDGQPLRYRRNPDGTFLLYSIGEDGIDDGGNPVQKDPRLISNWLNGRDCVWPSPATEEEIQVYYKKLSSKSD